MKPKSLFVLSPQVMDTVYGPDQREAIDALTEVVLPPMGSEGFRQCDASLAEVEILFSSWGAPRLDVAALNKLPGLRAVFYGAGSVKPLVTNEMWEQGVRICSAFGANAVPVAEFTLANIILGLKRAWPLCQAYRSARGRPARLDLIGGYGSTVGLVSLGAVGRRVAKLVKQAMDVDLLLCDPYLSPQQCTELGGSRVELEELFERSDVVSLHTPKLPETQGMIQAKHFRSMRQNGVFINTSRGAVVNEGDLIACAKEREDLAFYLDVTEPEPPPKESALYDLPNVYLTPHIAGALGNEHARLGQAMVEECRRFLRGEPLLWEIKREQLARMA